MKQFIVDRHTTPNTPTLEQVPTDKIPLYPTEQDLLDDLANLEVGQIAGTIDPAESELIGVLIQKIQELENGEKYSTEEVKTNKKWIDGKPIYRMCGNATGSVVFNRDDDPKTVPISWFNTNVKSDVDKIIEVKTGQEGIALGCYWRQTIMNAIGISLFYNGSRGYGMDSNTVFCIEYTKTTDD